MTTETLFDPARFASSDAAEAHQEKLAGEGAALADMGSCGLDGLPCAVCVSCSEEL